MRRPLGRAEAAEGASVLVLGLSHATSPVEQRERAALSEAGARALLRELRASDAIGEAVALSTCNRTEVYLVSADPAHAEDVAAGALVAHSAIARGELACARYLLRDDRAVRQLLRVAASLDSMVVGESEIQGQVRAHAPGPRLASTPSGRSAPVTPGSHPKNSSPQRSASSGPSHAARRSGPRSSTSSGRATQPHRPR